MQACVPHRGHSLPTAVSAALVVTMAHLSGLVNSIDNGLGRTPPMGSVVGPYPLLPSSIHCRPASAAASQQPAPAWCSHSLTQPSLPLLSAMRALTSSLFALVTRLQMAVVELCVAEHAHSSTAAELGFSFHHRWWTHIHRAQLLCYCVRAPDALMIMVPPAPRSPMLVRRLRRLWRGGQPDTNDCHHGPYGRAHSPCWWKANEPAGPRVQQRGAGAHILML
jgi:hypothetical protein